MSDVSRMIDEAGTVGNQYAELLVKFPQLDVIKDSCDILDCEKIIAMFVSVKESLVKKTLVIKAGTKVKLKPSSSSYSFAKNGVAEVISCSSSGAVKIAYENGFSLSTSTIHLEICEDNDGSN